MVQVNGNVGSPPVEGEIGPERAPTLSDGRNNIVRCFTFRPIVLMKPTTPRANRTGREQARYRSLSLRRRPYADAPAT